MSSDQGSLPLCKLEIQIPFPSKREAEIVYNSLRVDIEPTRKHITKKLTLNNNSLFVELAAPDIRSLRIGVNSFMDFALLSIETMKKFSGIE